MDTTPDIAVDARDNGLVWITIDRPRKHNALARPVLDACSLRVASNREGQPALDEFRNAEDRLG